jgi:hypothetical protein
MTRFKQVSRNCLRGQPLPDDLRRLWKANDTQPWNDIVPFTLVERLDNDFFTGYREKDGVSIEVVTAYRRMFEHIAFVGKREDGELVGYWLGPENRAASASPIVELDTEGQFHIRGRNLAEYLLACAFSEVDFAELRGVLADLGLAVTAETRSELFDSLDASNREFGNPNRISRRYQKGLDSPPPSKLRFGIYGFPVAAEVLREIGVENITVASTREQVIQLLGNPDESGGDNKVPVLGYIDPWIKYKRPDCQLRFAFEKGKGVKQVTLLEPDWEPGT